MKKILAPHSSLLTPLRGQALLLVTIAIGGIILGATTIAGLITTYQIRRATDVINSQKAIFAADAGIECGLYQFFSGGTCLNRKTLGNGARYVMSLEPVAQTVISRGYSGTARRAFQLFVGGL